MGKNKRYNSYLALGGLALLGALCLPQTQPFGLREGFCILVPALMVALWQGYTLYSVRTIVPVVLFMAVGLLLPRWMYGAFPVKWIQPLCVCALASLWQDWGLYAGWRVGC